MTNLVKSKRFASLFVLAVVVLGAMALPLGGGTTSISGQTPCPATVRVRGSTTVFPITQASEGPFEVTRPGADVTIAAIGSGAGLNELISTGGGDPSVNEVAPSSRPLNAGELAQAYDFPIGRDGFVMMVKNSVEMDFISNISKAQVEGIYEGTITNWNQLGASGSHPIVPRARITESGSQPDFLTSFAVASALEVATINATGKPRLVESLHMAQAAAATPYEIAYSSLANLDVPGIKVLTLNGVAANQGTVSGGTYPAPRQLHLAVLKTAVQPRIDSTIHVLADDWVNYALTPAGQAFVNAQGFVSEQVPLVQPIPDFDVNLNGSTSLSDLGQVTAKWGLDTNCNGWIRADVNNSSSVTLGDIGGVTSKWGNQGFIPPN